MSTTLSKAPEGDEAFYLERLAEVRASTGLQLDMYEGLLVRRNTEDRKMVRDALYEDYPYANCKDHIVLDLGGHVGGFTKRALMDDALAVYTVEPWPPNRQILELNFDEHPRVSIMPIAIAPTPTVTLSIPADRSTGGVSGFINHKCPTQHVEVEARTVESLVSELKPTFLKVDIEAAEWSVFPCNIDGVKEICGELHTMSRGNRQKAFEFLAWLEQIGFTITFLVGGPQSNYGRIMYMNFHATRKSGLPPKKVLKKDD